MSVHGTDAAIARDVVAKLEALIDPANTDCAVPIEHKEGVRLYVPTWVLPLARLLSTLPAHRTLEQAGMYHRISRGRS